MIGSTSRPSRITRDHTVSHEWRGDRFYTATFGFSTIYTLVEVCKVLSEGVPR